MISGQRIGWFCGALTELTVGKSQSIVFAMSKNERINKRIFVDLILGHPSLSSDPQKVIAFVLERYRPEAHKNRDEIRLSRQKNFYPDRWQYFLSHQEHLPKKMKTALAHVAGARKPFSRRVLWRDLQSVFRRSGFRVFQSRGGIDFRLFLFLISQRYFPVTWFYFAPERGAPLDVLHDLGHGLAMLDDDYTENMIRFAKTYMATRQKQNIKQVYQDFTRFFECAFVQKSDGSMEPIGADSVNLENFTSSRRKSANKALRRLGRFSSRAEWHRELRLTLRRMRQA